MACLPSAGSAASFFSGLDLVVSGAYVGLKLCQVGFECPHTLLPAVCALGEKADAVPEVFDVGLGLQALRFPWISTLFNKTNQLAWRACRGLGLTVFSGLC